MGPRSAIHRAAGLLVAPLIFFASHLVPRDDHTWLFMTNDDAGFADNSKYLFLHCNDKEDIRNIWIATAESEAEMLRAEGYEAYSVTSLRGRYHLLRGGVFFETHGPLKPSYSGGTRIVHLTHGNYLKTMLDDHTRDWPRPVEVVVELLFERRRRYVVTSSGLPLENMKSMRSAPERRMLVTGFPRNDVLLQEIDGERLGVNELELDEFRRTARDKDVLLYAPTHRQAYGEQNGIPLANMELGFQELDGVLAEYGAVLYVSPHPASSVESNFDEYDYIRLLDTGGDLYPFLRETDALVTDYSGVFYDYLLVDRSIIFFAPDLEPYTNDRNLYFDYEKHVTGPIATDAEAFVDAVDDVLTCVDEYGDRRAELRDEFYENPDGEASERVYRAVVSE